MSSSDTTRPDVSESPGLLPAVSPDRLDVNTTLEMAIKETTIHPCNFRDASFSFSPLITAEPEVRINPHFTLIWLVYVLRLPFKQLSKLWHDYQSSGTIFLMKIKRELWRCKDRCCIAQPLVMLYFVRLASLFLGRMARFVSKSTQELSNCHT